MSRVCATIFLFALFSICDGQADKPQINEPGFTCTAGRLFTYDCNTCTCDDSGTLARCTAMACPPEERSKRSDPEEACTPGEMKMKVCNRCRCTDSRIWACTRKFCTDAIVEVEDMNNDNHQQKLKRSVDEEASTAEPMVEKCKTGDKKINDCNDCFCTKHGDWVCTLMACPPWDDKVVRSVVEDHLPETCVYGEQRDVMMDHDKCERCKCSQSRNWNCKRRCTNPERDEKSQFEEHLASQNGNTTETSENSVEVTPEEFGDEDFKCVPNATFKLECNTCWCNADGKGAKYCTRIACHPKTYRPLTEQQDAVNAVNEDD